MQTDIGSYEMCVCVTSLIRVLLSYAHSLCNPRLMYIMCEIQWRRILYAVRDAVEGMRSGISVVV